MIEKPTIIITSLGRTGTLFFATLFGEMIPDSTALHEPDILTTTELRRGGKGVRHLVSQVRDAGAYNMLVRKPLGRWGLAKLSDDRIRGRLSRSEAVRRVRDQRTQFVHSRDSTVYIESSTACYGLIDILPEVFAHHRVAYTVRDGRDWIRSWMNSGQRGGMYTKGKIRSIFARNWPTAMDVEDEYSAIWQDLSWFEKLCWAWRTLNGYALKTVDRNGDARVFRFEDIFKSGRRYDHLAELVHFVTDLPGVEPVPSEALEGWLDRGIHGSSGDFPAWDDWSIEQQETFLAMCGPLMEKLGYRLNDHR